MANGKTKQNKTAALEYYQLYMNVLTDNLSPEYSYIFYLTIHLSFEKYLN